MLKRGFNRASQQGAFWFTWLKRLDETCVWPCPVPVENLYCPFSTSSLCIRKSVVLRDHEQALSCSYASKPRLFPQRWLYSFRLSTERNAALWYSGSFWLSVSLAERRSVVAKLVATTRLLSCRMSTWRRGFCDAGAKVATAVFSTNRLTVNISCGCRLNVHVW